MNENAEICKNCNSEKGWHIIPNLNCSGSRDGTYQGGIFFEPMPEPEPTLAEIIKANDELVSKIMLQLDAINSEIQTINQTLKALQ